MKKLFALSACALALAACSNNGGTYYGKPQMGSHNTMQGSNSTPDQGKPQMPPPAAAANDTDKSLATGEGSFAFPDDANVRKIAVNGKEFDLSNTNFGAILNDDWRSYVGSTGNRIGTPPPEGLQDITVWNGAEHAFVGIAKPSNSDTRFAFFNGNFTNEQSLPTTGNVMYDAYVTVSEPGAFRSSKHELTADFGTKKLTGQYSDEVMLNATISGNRFESEKGAATTVKGGFFGDNAAEIAGTFHKGNLLGAFGGKKKEAAAAPAQPQ